MSGITINGPFVIGYTLCFSFMGALVVQSYYYYTNFTDDRKTIKILVTSILLLETLMTTFTFYAFWTSLTSEVFYTLDPLITPGPGTRWSLVAVLAPITGIVTTLTHGFYCWRIVTLWKSHLLPLIIMMVSLLQLASIIFLAISHNLYPSNEIPIGTPGPTSPFPYQIILYSLSPWLVTWLGSSVFCDLSITICMTLSLRPSKMHFRSNKSTLVKLTRLTIETGLVTTVAALLELILGVVYEEQMYHIAVFYAISKLYSNCLLASLNFRVALRSQSNPELSTIVWDDMELNTRSSLRRLDPQPTHQQSMVRAESDVVNDVIDLDETVRLRKSISVEDQT